MKRRVPILLLLMLLLGTACQKGSPVRTVQTPVDAASEITAIDFGYVPKDLFEPTIDHLITAFEKRFPQYRINRVALPPNGPDQFAEMDRRLKSGVYDIIPSDEVSLHLDRIARLEAYLARSQPELARIARLSDDLRHAGELYQIPIMLQQMAFVANLELWAKAGLQAPASDWSWDQFREAASRLTEGEGDSKVWGFNTFSPEALVTLYLEETGKPYWLAEEKDLRAALHLFAGMVQVDQSLPAPPPRDWGGGPVITTAPRFFEDGQAALEYRRLLPLSQMKQLFSSPWDIAPVPVGPGQKPLMSTDTKSLMIAASSEQKDAAWEFIRFAASPEGAAVVAAAGGIPADRAALQPEVWSDLPPGTTHLLTTPWLTEKITTGDGSSTNMQLELLRLTNLTLRGGLDPDTAVTQYLEFRKQYVKN